MHTCNWPEVQICTHAQCILPRCYFWQPLIVPEGRKERSCQSFSASHIGPRADCPFHRPAFFRPARDRIRCFAKNVLAGRLGKYRALYVHLAYKDVDLFSERVGPRVIFLKASQVSSCSKRSRGVTTLTEPFAVLTKIGSQWWLHVASAVII